MKYVKDWDKIQKRYTALMNCEIIDRCCVSIYAQKTPGKSFGELCYPKAGDDKLKFWTDPEDTFRRYDEFFEHTYFAGEAVPTIIFNLGTAGQVGYMMNMTYDVDDTVWFHPFINDWDKDELIFDENSFLYKAQMDLIKYCASKSNGDYLIGMPDNVGNIDALAHLRGTENLIYDMIDCPNKIHQALKKMQKVWERVTDEAYELCWKNNYGGSSIGWLSTYAKGKHTQLQGDISVMLSPDMQKEFALPELEQQAQYLDSCVYHLDGQEQVRHLDAILAVDKINMIQWTDVAGQPRATHHLPSLQRIQAAGKGLLLKVAPQEIEFLMENLSSKGLYLITYANDEDMADDILKKVSKLTKD